MSVRKRCEIVIGARQILILNVSADAGRQTLAACQRATLQFAQYCFLPAPFAYAALRYRNDITYSLTQPFTLCPKHTYIICVGR